MSPLASLAARRPVVAPVAVVVAHPDDETLALGGSLHLLGNLLLVHVTDGAPRRLEDAARHGFASPEAYAAARAAELDRALALSGAAPARCQLGVTDQDAVDAVPTITAQLRDLFRNRDITAVFTHAFEGGHPDHDAVAMAVAGTGAPVFEFPLYHLGSGSFTAQAFLPGGPVATALTLDPGEAARKRAMLGCFATQTEFLSRFDPAIERLRPAPPYDFTQPPHPEPLLYEQWGWIDFPGWRRRCGA